MTEPDDNTKNVEKTNFEHFHKYSHLDRRIPRKQKILLKR